MKRTNLSLLIFFIAFHLFAQDDSTRSKKISIELGFGFSPKPINVINSKRHILIGLELQYFESLNDKLFLSAIINPLLTQETYILQNNALNTSFTQISNKNVVTNVGLSFAYCRKFKGNYNQKIIFEVGEYISHKYLYWNTAIVSQSLNNFPKTSDIKKDNLRIDGSTLAFPPFIKISYSIGRLKISSTGVFFSHRNLYSGQRLVVYYQTLNIGINL